MDHIAAGESKGRRDFGLPCFTAAQRLTGPQKLRAGGAMDGAVHAAAPQKRAISGIHNGIHMGNGNIS